MLIAVQLRLEVALGSALLEGAVVQSPALFGILAATAIVTSYSIQLVRQQLGITRSRRSHFMNLLVALLLAFVTIVLLLPAISLLQLTYFVVFGVLFGLITIWWTPTLPGATEETTLYYHLRQLWERRALLKLWTVSNIEARYSEAALGIMWIVILPLSQSIILAVVFSNIIRAVDIGPTTYVAFFLTALTFFSFFQQGVLTATGSIIGAMGVVVQVYFPREILVLVKLVEAAVDLLFMFLVMLIINALLGSIPGVHILLLPLIFAVQVVLTLGLMLFVSYLSVMIRDIPQLIGIVIQFLFYLTPILYPASQIPEQYRFAFTLNPLAGIVEAYRAVLLYQTAPSLVSLYYPAVIGGVMLYSGYLFFKSNELNLADYV